MQVVVEDEEGTVVQLSMYNVTTGSRRLTLECVCAFLGEAVRSVVLSVAMAWWWCF